MLRRWLAHGERGQSAIEFVLVLPFVLVIVFMVIEATSMLRTYSLLENASREGARAAAVGNASGACAVAQDRFGQALTCTPPAAGAPGTPITVSVSYIYTYQTPLLRVLSYATGDAISDTKTMTAQTTMRQE